MAVTWSATINKKTTYGDQMIVFATLSASGTYTTGGDNVNPALVGLDVIDYCDITIVQSAALGTTGFVGQITPGVGSLANAKLQVYGMAAAAGVGTPLAEASAGTTLTGFIAIAEFRGC